MLENMEMTAKRRSIATTAKLTTNTRLFVGYGWVKREFYYYTVDSSLTKPGVHNLDGFTDITREEAVKLLASVQ